MVDFFLFIPIVLSFILTVLLMPYWIRKVHSIGLIWDDMNKVKAPRVAGSGGIITVLAFIVGVLIFIAYRTFYLNTSDFLVEMLALIAVVLLLTGIGLVDDLFGWKQGGLSRRSRLILVACTAIPLMAINAGKSTILLPFVGLVDMGVVYPLILIPLAVMGTATTFNFLAGFNGLEALQGVLLIGSLSFVAFFTGSSWLAIIGLCMVAALLGLLFFNWYPARVFPGDSVTYAIGGMIAIMAILGNFERIALFFFIPVIIEVFLKVRGGLVKHSFGKPSADGSLTLRYDKIYSLNHVAIWLLQKMGCKPREHQVVLLIGGFQLIVIIAGLAIFRGSIFP